MKLSDIHADRIAAMGSLANDLGDVLSNDTAVALADKAQELARFLIDAAPDNADPGRLTHAIDSLRESLSALSAAIGIGHAKAKRMRLAEPDEKK